MVATALAVLTLLSLLAGCSSPIVSTPTSAASRSAPRVTVGRAEAGPLPASAPAPLRVVGLGDSVMAGTNCGCTGITQQYADQLAARTHRAVSATNLGVNGLVTSGLLQQLQTDARTRADVGSADVVLVTIGANDLLPQFAQWQQASCDEACYTEPAQQMGSNLAQVLQAVAALRTKQPGVVLVTDYWNVFTDGEVARGTGGQAQIDWSTDVTQAANTAICSAAEGAGDSCVDLFAPFKTDTGQGDPTSLLAADGDHPNAAGVQAIVSALMDATPQNPG